MCCATLADSDGRWKPNASEMLLVEEEEVHVKQESRKTHVTPTLAIQQYRQPTASVCV